MTIEDLQKYIFEVKDEIMEYVDKLAFPTHGKTTFEEMIHLDEKITRLRSYYIGIVKLHQENEKRA